MMRLTCFPFPVNAMIGTDYIYIICVCMYVCVCMCVFMYVLCMCMYVCVCMYVYMYVDMYHWAISRSSQCPTMGVTKAVVCVILSVG